MAISVSAATTTTFPTAIAGLVVNLSTPTAGALLVVNLGLRNTATFTPPSGWTQVAIANSASVGVLAVFTKVATGSEGSTATFTSSVTNIGGAQCRTITGSDTATAVATATANSGGLTGTTANPPSLTPSWGSDATVWLAYMATAASGAVTSAAPTSYTDLAFTNVAAGGSSGGTGSAYRALTAATEDPGAFTSAADRWWMAATVAVKPAASGTPGQGTSSGTWAWLGTASGSSARSGDATGTWSWTGTASGSTTRSGAGSGTWSWLGTAAGSSARSGDATGTWAWTGTAAGAIQLGPVDPHRGTARLAGDGRGEAHLAAAPITTAVLAPAAGTAVLVAARGTAVLTSAPGTAVLAPAAGTAVITV